MFCQKCGNEIDNEAVVCPKCGCATNNFAKKEEAIGPDEVSVGLVIFSILIPIAGVILGINNITKKKSKSGTTYLVCGMVAWIVAALILTSL